MAKPIRGVEDIQLPDLRQYWPLGVLIVLLLGFLMYGAVKMRDAASQGTGGGSDTPGDSIIQEEGGSPFPHLAPGE